MFNTDLDCAISSMVRRKSDVETVLGLGCIADVITEIDDCIMAEMKAAAAARTKMSESDSDRDPAGSQKSGAEDQDAIDERLFPNTSKFLQVDGDSGEDIDDSDANVAKRRKVAYYKRYARTMALAGGSFKLRRTTPIYSMRLSTRCSSIASKQRWPSTPIDRSFVVGLSPSLSVFLSPSLFFSLSPLSPSLSLSLSLSRPPFCSFLDSAYPALHTVVAMGAPVPWEPWSLQRLGRLGYSACKIRFR